MKGAKKEGVWRSGEAVEGRWEDNDGKGGEKMEEDRERH